MWDTHSEEQHLSLSRGVHHVGLCDTAALTKPCGNMHGTADRSEERGSGTDGQTVAALELQQGSEQMRDNCMYEVLKLVKTDFRKRVLKTARGAAGSRVLGCEDYFADTFPPCSIPPAISATTDTSQEKRLHFQSQCLLELTQWRDRFHHTNTHRDPDTHKHTRLC